MATNKHATIRYQTLDKCFRNPGRRYFIEDLVEACNKSIYEFSGTDTGFRRDKFLKISNSWKAHKDGMFPSSRSIKVNK